MGVVTNALALRAPTILKRVAGPNAETSAIASSTSQRRIGKSNPQLYRNWATYSPWIRAGFDVRSGQLQRAEYDLGPFDRDMRKPDPGLMRRIREVLDQPNPGDPSYATFISAIAEDMLALDAGAIEKERVVRGEIIYLWPTDGGAIKVDRLWSGNPREPRYYFCPDPQVEVPLLNSDLVYIKIHNRSSSPIGISYLETLRMTIDAELANMLYNARTVKQAAPDGIMDMGENARSTQVESFKAFWDNEIAGQGMMAFWGGTKNAKYIDFHKSNRDMQMMEWEILLVRQIAAVLQLSPQDLGVTFDVNRASGEVQQQNTEDRGLRTLLGTVQDYITSEICWDPGWGGRENNIAFRFRAVSDRQSLTKAQTHKFTLAGMPSQTINEARTDIGLPPIGDPTDITNPYNQLMANTAQGLVTLEKIPTAYELSIGAPSAAATSVSPPDPETATIRAKEIGAMEIDPLLLEIKADMDELS